MGPHSANRRAGVVPGVGVVDFGLLIWAVAIAWPGWLLPGLLLGALMVVFASFGLITEP